MARGEPKRLVATAVPRPAARWLPVVWESEAARPVAPLLPEALVWAEVRKAEPELRGANPRVEP